MPLKPALAVLCGAILAACLLAGPAAAKTVWLCDPATASDPCRGSLDATRLSPDGTQKREHRANAKNAPIDCFYVYPTVSDQRTINATRQIDPAQRAIALQQASRFSERCRVWAPMYRQLTLLGIAGATKVTPAARARAYGDVRGAWRDYLAHHNHGRGFVLLGHSQGSFVLRKLIAEEIDKRPAVRRRLVSALLLGGNVTVRKGKDSGGDFRNVPACRSATQIGCVIAYSTYGETPPANSLFGRVANGRLQVLCTNPADLAGGTGTLKPYLATTPFPGTLGIGIQILLGGVQLPQVPTAWLAPTAGYTARCSTAGGASVLRVTPLDGAVQLHPSPDATWGLHLADVNLPLGNLTEIVGKQAAAYARGGH
jgi:hypothetical protein